jgi:hypothetical protein
VNVKRMNEINSMILSCTNLKINNPTCSRDEQAFPLIMEPNRTQKLLLITRDPSNIANVNRVLLDWRNTFFRNHILEIFFREYEKKKAKKDIEYFNIFREMFARYIYWTHYSKCFPGIKDGKHKKPNVICSYLFLEYEINAMTPEVMVLVGKDAIEAIMNKDHVEAIQSNGNNFINKIPVICLTHPANTNNKCKRDPKYRYNETVELIRSIVKDIV